ncbi:cytochrome P450 2D4-like [Liolophura sinensis]|uniref:cytochrome P450 2D4-like n=1 Tax=Liolophura sinensis TaxID=3198878 RepID=UPI0031597B72
MDALSALLCLLLVLITLYWALIGRSKSHNLPPGPKGWPLFGSIFQISATDSHKDFLKLSEQYGDVIAVNMAGNPVVVLNSADAIREAFFSTTTRDVFAGRPRSFYAKYSDRGPSLLFTGFCKEMMQQRKIYMKTLKMYGEEGMVLENIIRDEIQIVVKKIRERRGQPIDIGALVIPALANIILTVMSGKSFEYDDPALLATLEFELYNVQMLTGHIATIMSAFPFLRHIPLGYGKLFKGHRRSYDTLVYYFVTLAKEAFDPATSRGLVADLFRLQSEYPWITDDKIKGALRDCVGAGIGTTRGTILAFFLVILHKPVVMSKIQSEISSVIGRCRAPCVADRVKMPYTEAVVMELLRYISHVPMGAPHSTVDDVTFRGYVIPAKTTVLTNLWAVHHDDRIWEEPWEFLPERFLDEEGNVVPPEHKNRRNWLVFGTGRRACPGEYFGRSRVFLFITTLLQQFNFRPCAEHPLPSHDPRGYTTGITLHPPRYYLLADDAQM